MRLVDTYKYISVDFILKQATNIDFLVKNQDKTVCLS